MSRQRSTVLSTIVCLLVVLAISVTAVRRKKRMKIIDGSLTDVSVGPVGVWGVNSNGEIFYRNGTYRGETNKGNIWIQVAGSLSQIDVGTDVLWGINSEGNVYYVSGVTPDNLAGNGWQNVPGTLKYVTVSRKGHVWGIGNSNNVLFLNEASIMNPGGSSWTEIPGVMTQISAGYAGVWAVNNDNRIYYRTGTYGDNCERGSGWEEVKGRGILMKYVASGDGYVVALSTNGTIYYRKGMTFVNPIGDKWREVVTDQEDLTSVDVFHRRIWAVNSTSTVLFRKMFESISHF